MALLGEVVEAMTSFSPQKAVGSIFAAIATANSYLQTAAPWLESTDQSVVQQSMYLSLEALRLSAILLQPFMPSISREILDRLDVAHDQRALEDAQLGKGRYGQVKRGPVLFPPVDTPAIAAQ